VIIFLTPNLTIFMEFLTHACMKNLYIVYPTDLGHDLGWVWFDLWRK